MREVIADVERWRQEGKAIALATVIETWGSAPRGVGAKMAFTADARISGSVSGGCVEAAVVEEGIEVLKVGRPRRLQFGVADEEAWAVGLACGGQIEVFVEPLDLDCYRVIHDSIREERSIAKVTVVDGPEETVGRAMTMSDRGEVVGGLTGDLKATAVEEAGAALSRGRGRRIRLAGGEETTDLFIDVLLPSPTLVMVGGVHIAVTLAFLARTLSYRTVVIDPRVAFGSRERFSHVDQLIQEWPDEAFGRVEINRSTAIATLTHDPKLDDPALNVALRSPAFYVGALGSKKTQTKRRKRLLEHGISEEQLSRLMAPIGIQIGSTSPEEIALSVMAQVVAARNGSLAR